MAKITKNNVIKDLHDFKDYIDNLNSESESWEPIHTRLIGIYGRLNSYIMGSSDIASISNTIRIGNELSEKLEHYTSDIPVSRELRLEISDWLNSVVKNFDAKVNLFFVENWNTDRVKDLLLSTISKLKSLN